MDDWKEVLKLFAHTAVDALLALLALASLLGLALIVDKAQ